jgi:hypothetical protein
MIAHLMMGFLAEVVFRLAASTGKGFEAEVARYLERQNLAGPGETKQALSR